MIQNKTARNIMYAWHGGQSSDFYAAASSGLVESFDSLLLETSKCILLAENNKDREQLIKLGEWLKHKKAKIKTQVFIQNSYYFVLPWVSRSYYK